MSAASSPTRSRDDVSTDRAPRAKRLLPWGGGRCDRRHCSGSGLSSTANHTWRPGVMQMRDLQAYVTPKRAPTHVNYRGLDVYSMGPPSSGGSTVSEALNILEGYPLSSMPRVDGTALLPRGVALFVRRPQHLPRRSRLLRCAFDRAAVQGLRGYTPRADHHDRGARSGSARGPSPFNVAVAGATALQSETTTHLTTSDTWGNSIVHVHDRVDRRLRPRRARLRVPAEQRANRLNFDSTTHPNRVEGGKRPRSSMSPTIVLDHGTPFLALGSPGGSTIITTVLQILIDRLDQGMTLPRRF